MFALQNGCEPSLYVTAISELILSKKVDRGNEIISDYSNITTLLIHTTSYINT